MNVMIVSSVAAAAAMWLGAQAAPEGAVPAGAEAPGETAAPVLRNPNWVARPTGADVQSVYPREALVQRLNGRATIACEAAANGSLANCVVASESPAGAGFGAAALSLAPKFRMAERAADGSPVQGARVRIPISFRIA